MSTHPSLLADPNLPLLTDILDNIYQNDPNTDTWEKVNWSMTTGSAGKTTITIHLLQPLLRLFFEHQVQSNHIHKVTVHNPYGFTCEEMTDDPVTLIISQLTIYCRESQGLWISRPVCENNFDRSELCVTCYNTGQLDD